MLKTHLQIWITILVKLKIIYVNIPSALTYNNFILCLHMILKIFDWFLIKFDILKPRTELLIVKKRLITNMDCADFYSKIKQQIK